MKKFKLKKSKFKFFQGQKSKFKSFQGQKSPEKYPRKTQVQYKSGLVIPLTFCITRVGHNSDKIALEHLRMLTPCFSLYSTFKGHIHKFSQSLNWEHLYETLSLVPRAMTAVEILEFPFPTHQPLGEVQSKAQDSKRCGITPDWGRRLVLVCQVILACGRPYGGTTWHLSLTPLEYPILTFHQAKTLHKAQEGKRKHIQNEHFRIGESSAFERFFVFLSPSSFSLQGTYGCEVRHNVHNTYPSSKNAPFPCAQLQKPCSYLYQPHRSYNWIIFWSKVPHTPLFWVGAYSPYVFSHQPSSV